MELQGSAKAKLCQGVVEYSRPAQSISGYSDDFRFLIDHECSRSLGITNREDILKICDAGVRCAQRVIDATARLSPKQYLFSILTGVGNKQPSSCFHIDAADDNTLDYLTILGTIAVVNPNGSEAPRTYSTIWVPEQYIDRASIRRLGDGSDIEIVKKDIDRYINEIVSIDPESRTLDFPESHFGVYWGGLEKGLVHGSPSVPNGVFRLLFAADIVLEKVR